MSTDHGKLHEMHLKLDGRINAYVGGTIAEDSDIKKIEAEIRTLHKKLGLPGPARSVRSIYAGLVPRYA